MKMQTYCVLQPLKYLQQFAACITNMSVTVRSKSVSNIYNKIMKSGQLHLAQYNIY